MYIYDLYHDKSGVYLVGDELIPDFYATVQAITEKMDPALLKNNWFQAIVKAVCQELHLKEISITAAADVEEIRDEVQKKNR